MKKLIAVLLVVFACFSLTADDIPMDWYVQIVKALDHFSASAFEEWKLEKVDEQTVKMSKKITPETIRTIVEEKSSETEAFYFRFNLSNEEAASDRYLFMTKVGEIFSRGGWLTTSDEDNHERVGICFASFDTGGDDWNTRSEMTDLHIYQRLKGFTSLHHYFYYSCSIQVT